MDIIAVKTWGIYTSLSIVDKEVTYCLLFENGKMIFAKQKREGARDYTRAHISDTICHEAWNNVRLRVLTGDYEHHRLNVYDTFVPVLQALQKGPVRIMELTYVGDQHNKPTQMLYCQGIYLDILFKDYLLDKATIVQVDNVHLYKNKKFYLTPFQNTPDIKSIRLYEKDLNELCYATLTNNGEIKCNFFSPSFKIVDEMKEKLHVIFELM